jgi:hypothetical protein
MAASSGSWTLSNKVKIKVSDTSSQGNGTNVYYVSVSSSEVLIDSVASNSTTDCCLRFFFHPDSIAGHSSSK